MKVETEFERRLREILTEYPDIDPARAALALKGQPEATNEQIAQLSKVSPKEAERGAPKPSKPTSPTSTGPNSPGWKAARKVAEWLQERDPGSPVGQKYLQQMPQKQEEASPPTVRLVNEKTGLVVYPKLEKDEQGNWQISNLDEVRALLGTQKEPAKKISPKLRQMLKENLLLKETLSLAKEAQGWATMAESAFLVLSRKWYADVQEVDKNTALPRAVDILALSCLILAVEWGHKFTEVPRHQMETNREAAAANRNPPWYDSLPWELCQVPFMMVAPSETIEVGRLTGNLDHHDSSIRCWMMEIGWMARSWMAAPEAMPLLLKNLADTLGGPFKAAGLAAALVSTADEFWTLARDFKHHDDSFAEQYARRLKLLEEHGIFDIQASFWKLEAQCRKAIADAVLGLRLVPPGRQ